MPPACSANPTVMTPNCTLSIADLSLQTGNNGQLSDRLLYLDGTDGHSIYPTAQSTFVDGHAFTLVTQGEAQIQINGNDYGIGPSDIIILSPIHLMRICKTAHDYRSQTIIADKRILNESLSLPYIRLYNHPVVHLSPTSSTLLSDCLSNIAGCMDRTEHHLWRELVLNSLQRFLIELNDVLTSEGIFGLSADSVRNNAVFHDFLSLLLRNYRKEHNIDFYANRLHMSIHNLGRIIKSVTNVSPGEFIHEIIYMEARRLLSETDISIQQTAQSLCFSDQSAFGKFFKRKAGLSPAEYRKNIKWQQ